MMLWAPVLIFLGSWFPGCRSQQLSQPPSETVSPGRTVTLPCTLSAGFSSSSERVRWYQQKHGGAPVFIYHYYTSSDQGRGQGVPDRFSVTADTAGNRWNLVIVGVQPEDDGHYYCCSWYSSSYIFGPGTQMNVNTGETKAPALNIFPPSIEETAGKKATLVCQGQNYYPAALVWSWTVNGQTTNTGVDSTRPTKQTEDNLFMAASFLSIDAVDWKADKTFTCIATHEGKTFQASVKQSECV